MDETQDTRVERDSMGEMRVPADALYGATTARAVVNFPISGIRFSRPFLRAIGLIKGVAAEVNAVSACSTRARPGSSRPLLRRWPRGGGTPSSRSTSFRRAPGRRRT
jgi:hypothetical protein